MSSVLASACSERDASPTEDDLDWTWARVYHEGDASGPALAVLRTMEQLDSTLLTLTRGSDVASFGVLRLGQVGGVYDYETVTMSDASCASVPKGLASDGAGGAYVVGACGDVVVSGELHPTSGDDRMFAIRLDATGATKFAKDVTLVGSSSAHHVGFLGRVRTDGEVAFASFPGLSLGASTVFVVNSVAELPTTGYVVGGSTVDVTGSGVTTTAATAVVGLDAIGHTRWSKRFTLRDAGSPVASGFPGVRLSDDGGVVVAAIAQAQGGGVGGRLWAFEAVAKDGTLAGLDATRAREDDLGITDVTCGLTAAPWAPALAAMQTSSASSNVTAEIGSPAVEDVTP